MGRALLLGVVLVTASAIAATVVFQSGPGNADREADYYVATDGKDSNPGNKSTPFHTFNAAYLKASPGNLVAVAEGEYGDQTIELDPNKKSDEDVVFEARGDVHVGGDRPSGFQLTVNAEHLEFRGFRIRDADVTARDITFRDFVLGSGTFSGSKQIRFIDGEVTRPAHTSGRDDGLFFGVSSFDRTNEDVLVDNVYFHGVDRPASNADAHTDCIQFTQVTGATIRNSKFIRCDDATIIAKSDQGPILDLVIENNWFDDADPDNGTQSAFEPFLAGNFSTDTCSGVVRYNSINDTQRSLDCIPAAAGDVQYYGNIVRGMSATSCSDTNANVEIHHNLFMSGPACGGDSVVADPLWSNPAQFTTEMDLNPRPGSPAIDFAAGIPCVGRDRSGRARPRGSACDAGAEEAG